MTWKSAKPRFEDLAPSAWPKGYEWCELKYDGHFAEIICGATGWTVYSRNGKVKMSGPEKLPACHLSGEHIFGTQWSKAPAQRSLYDSIIVFGKLSGAGSLATLVKKLKSAGLPVTLAERFPVSQAPQLWKKHVEKGDWEGLVFKTETGHHARMKRAPTMDYVVLDIVASSAKTYAGWGAQAIVGGLFENGRLVKKVRVGGGLSAEMRRDLLARKNEFIGRVFEAHGKALFASGALRHPNFSRWRPDKPAKACTWKAA